MANKCSILLAEKQSPILAHIATGAFDVPASALSVLLSMLVSSLVSGRKHLQTVTEWLFILALLQPGREGLESVELHKPSFRGQIGMQEEMS